MDMIRERIEGGEYKDPQHFYDDFVLLFKNAKTYNLEGMSLIVVFAIM